MHRPFLLLFLLAACGSDGPPPVESAALPNEPVAPPLPSSPEPPAPERLDVVPPADLGQALAARYPTIELVPQSCAHPEADLIVGSDRLCLAQPGGRLVRVVRRLATTDLEAISAARSGDDVIFAVFDGASAVTRYTGRIWRWDLDGDRYLGLANLAGTPADPPQMLRTSFGIVVHQGMIGIDQLYAGGDLTRIFAIDNDAVDFYVAGTTTYRNVEREATLVVERVGHEGDRIVGTRVGSLPREARSFYLPFPGGRALVVTGRREGPRTVLNVLEPPSTEARTVTVELAAERISHVGPNVVLVTPEGRFGVDLATGVTTAMPPEDPPASRTTLRAKSLHDVVAQSDSVVLTTSGRHLRLGTAGLAWERREPPTSRRGPCRCEETTLRCGEREIPLACTEVAELEEMRDGDGERMRATVYDAVGRYRIDRLEPDYVRITRTADGARLWVRVFEDGALVQADDGAFAQLDEVPESGLALRWGPSLTTSLVTWLAPHRGHFERSTLVTDFFSGQPLPTADTTLPPPLLI